MTAPSPQGSDNLDPRKRSFLGIHYVKCGTYGRIYKNKDGNAYVGNCPGACIQLKFVLVRKEPDTAFLSVFARNRHRTRF